MAAGVSQDIRRARKAPCIRRGGGLAAQAALLQEASNRRRSARSSGASGPSARSPTCSGSPPRSATPPPPSPHLSGKTAIVFCDDRQPVSVNLNSTRAPCVLFYVTNASVFVPGNASRRNFRSSLNGQRWQISVWNPGDCCAVMSAGSPSQSRISIEDCCTHASGCSGFCTLLGGCLNSLYFCRRQEGGSHRWDERAIWQGQAGAHACRGARSPAAAAASSAAAGAASDTAAAADAAADAAEAKGGVPSAAPSNG